MEEERALAFIINSCEYCRETIPSLQEIIEKEIDESFKDKINFSPSESQFLEAINASLDRILKSIETKIKDHFKKFNSVSWTNFVKVQDNIPCIKAVLKLLRDTIEDMERSLHPDYFTSLMNKLAALIPSLYLEQVYSVKKCNEESSQQFQLDLIELKNALKHFLSQPSAKGGKKKAPRLFEKFLQKSFDKVESRLKIIGMTKEQLVDYYNKLVPDRSVADFERILKIRGIKATDVPLDRIEEQ